MKKLGKLKLNQLSKVELEQREMNALRGGCYCSCGCYPSDSLSGNLKTHDNYAIPV